MAKEKKKEAPEEDTTVKTPRPPQHIDPSSPPGKGRNKEDDKRGDIEKRNKKG